MRGTGRLVTRVCAAAVAVVALVWGAAGIAGARTTTGPVQDSLGLVSCASASFCLALGSYSTATGTHVLAEKWNGSGWRTVASPGISARDLSCRSASLCMAIDGTSAARWNGTSWHLVRVVPAGVHGVLYAISCPAATSCVAVGTQGLTFGNQTVGLAFGAVWNGRAWREKDPPAICVTYPPGPQCGEVSISCPGVTFCLATGAEQPAQDSPSPDAEAWNGTGWAQAAPPGYEVSGLSCASPSFCLGFYAGAPPGLMALWSGSQWQTLTQPGGGIYNLSCASSTMCMALGAPAQEWNGTGWQAQSMPQPSGQPIGLGTVSCPSATDCVAVGGYRTASGGSHTLAEIWNGTTWRVSLPPNPA